MAENKFGYTWDRLQEVLAGNKELKLQESTADSDLALPRKDGSVAVVTLDGRTVAIEVPDQADGVNVEVHVRVSLKRKDRVQLFNDALFAGSNSFTIIEAQDGGLLLHKPEWVVRGDAKPFTGKVRTFIARADEIDNFKGKP